LEAGTASSGGGVPFRLSWPGRGRLVVGGPAAAVRAWSVSSWRAAVGEWLVGSILAYVGACRARPRRLFLRAETGVVLDPGLSTGGPLVAFFPAGCQHHSGGEGLQLLAPLSRSWHPPAVVEADVTCCRGWLSTHRASWPLALWILHYPRF